MAMYSKKAQDKISEVMHEYKHGELESGKDGKGGKVKSREQAVAIALSEARDEGAKVPAKKTTTAKKKGGSSRKSGESRKSRPSAKRSNESPKSKSKSAAPRKKTTSAKRK